MIFPSPPLPVRSNVSPEPRRWSISADDLVLISIAAFAVLAILAVIAGDLGWLARPSRRVATTTSLSASRSAHRGGGIRRHEPGATLEGVVVVSADDEEEGEVVVMVEGSPPPWRDAQRVRKKTRNAAAEVPRIITSIVADPSFRPDTAAEDGGGCGSRCNSAVSSASTLCPSPAGRSAAASPCLSAATCGRAGGGSGDAEDEGGGTRSAAPGWLPLPPTETTPLLGPRASGSGSGSWCAGRTRRLIKLLVEARGPDGPGLQGICVEMEFSQNTPTLYEARPPGVRPVVLHLHPDQLGGGAFVAGQCAARQCRESRGG